MPVLPGQGLLREGVEVSAVRPNPEQAAVIERLDGDLVVAAGAGTGKTATMARRFARAVTRDDGPREPMALEQVLAITFTRKAAAELSERVRRVLVGEHADGLALARHIDEAWISTIDSFCSRIVRRHALAAGVEPGFRVADDVLSGTMRGETLDEVVARARAEGGDGAALVDTYGDEAVRVCLGDAYDRIRTMGLTVADLEVAQGEPLGEAVAAFLDLVDDLERGILARPSRGTTLETSLVRCRELREGLAAAMALPPDECADAVLAVAPPAKPVTFSRASEPKDLAEAAEAGKIRLRTAATGAVCRPMMIAFKEMLAEFEEGYGRRKRAQGLLDLPDVTLAAARLFEQRPDVAGHYRSQFRLMMIDEFQDTNALQMRVFEPLRDDDLCVVGDDKQSIYGFRFADVDVFRGLRDAAGGATPLSENFRSHPDVLAFVNEVFGHPTVFGEDLTRLVAHRAAGESAGWPTDSPRVEVLAVAGSTLGEASAEEAEAALIAERIVALLAEGVSAGDVVVLLRGMPRAVTYAAALRDAGVPVHVASGEAFFDSAAVGDLRALLKALIVPDDDGAMVRVLAGPLVGVGSDALLAVREAVGRSASLASGLPLAVAGEVPGVCAEDREAFAAFLSAFDALRERASRVRVADLLREACTSLDYDLSLLASGADGPREWQNALKLMRMAADWDAAGAGDAGAFLGHLESCERYATAERAAPLAGEASAVRIMSVHGAKGLEFPVVFFARAHGQMLRNEAPALRVDRVDGRPLLSYKHPEDGSGHDGAPGSRYEEVRALARDLEQAEELRLAYVACTRAREALFVTGVAKGKDDAPKPGTFLGVLHTALGAPELSAAPGSAAVPAGRWTVADATAIVRPEPPAAEPSPGSAAAPRAAAPGAPADG
ncbi:MAG: hypothetical protein FDZ70_07845, partial [Actinobacteria bacterium]